MSTLPIPKLDFPCRTIVAPTLPIPPIFFTGVTYRRRTPLRAALRDALTTVRTPHPFAIHGGVLLPNHLHRPKCNHCLHLHALYAINDCILMGSIKP